MNKRTKTTLQFMTAGILTASFVFAGCNSAEEKKAGTNDTVTVKSMEVTTPQVIDTTKKDTAKIRPTPNPN